MVIELANEVRKVLGIVGNEIFKEMLAGPALKSHMASLQLRPLPEAMALDS